MMDNDLRSCTIIIEWNISNIFLQPAIEKEIINKNLFTKIINWLLIHTHNNKLYKYAYEPSYTERKITYTRFSFSRFLHAVG